MKRDNSLRKSSVIYINYMPRYTCCGIYIGEYILERILLAVPTTESNIFLLESMHDPSQIRSG